MEASRVVRGCHSTLVSVAIEVRSAARGDGIGPRRSLGCQAAKAKRAAFLPRPMWAMVVILGVFGCQSNKETNKEARPPGAAAPVATTNAATAPDAEEIWPVPFSSTPSDITGPPRPFGKWGFVTRDGTVVIEPRFPIADKFREGMASVAEETNAAMVTYGYIDRSGKYVIRPQFDSALGFAEGLAAAKVGEDWVLDANDKWVQTVPGKWGFIDVHGTFVIPAGFKDTAGIFTEGLAAVCVGGPQGDKWGYIGKNGQWVIRPAYEKAWPFQEGLGRVRIGEAMGFVDKTGRLVIPARYARAWNFNAGLAAVEMGEEPDQKIAFINKQGAVVIRPQYESVERFSEGLAAFRRQSVGDNGDEKRYQWGYMDTAGIVRIQPQFDLANEFHEGRAKVTVSDRPGGDTRFGYIDKSGTMVIPAVYDMAWDFHQGKALVRVNGEAEFLLIDTKGKVVKRLSPDSLAWKIRP